MEKTIVEDPTKPMSGNVKFVGKSKNDSWQSSSTSPYLYTLNPKFLKKKKKVRERKRKREKEKE